MTKNYVYFGGLLKKKKSTYLTGMTIKGNSKKEKKKKALV